MTLLELLKEAYSLHKNHQDQNFIPYKAARQIVTEKRIEHWSRSHPLCLEHGHECPQRKDLIRTISETNRLVFVVLIFAELEYLIKKLIRKDSRDLELFETGSFERICDSAGLSVEQTQEIIKHRRYVGVIFAFRGTQNVPRDAPLPFLKRESLDRYGSYGILYRVTIPGQHLCGYDDTALVAEKHIRLMSNPSQGDWNRILREVQTLQKRSNHPNVIRLLASYTLETNESGFPVKTLHLLFPLAEMNLAEWMTSPEKPLNVANLSKEGIQAYIYRSIYALVSGVSYLHKEVAGIVTAHHDLKPRNILVLNDSFKIADFGHSHLRPIIEGSATEGASGLGTYEYQPPEYWSQDGSRAKVKHGRAFDVWAIGCIIIELATLIVHGWQSKKVAEFGKERINNPHKNRTTPDSIQARSDVSFHNNLIVVNDWMSRLRECGGNRTLKEVLNIAARMLAPEARNRPYMWEVQMDLYEILKPYDSSIPDLGEDLCVRPPFRDWPRKSSSREIPLNLQPEIRQYTETPLHRAAKNGNRKRTIRLWELAWPLSLPDPNGETPRDIIKRSYDNELRKLEDEVVLMLKAARTGNLGELEKLFSLGLSPLMVDVNGSSALYEATISSQIHVIDFLLEDKAKEQLMLWNKVKLELPIHTAARIGFMEALSRFLRNHPDINVSGDGHSTALYHAANGSHSDAVRLLLKHKAQLLPSDPRNSVSGETPIFAAMRLGDGKACQMIELLLGADDSNKCMEHKNGSGLTPLLLAAHDRQYTCFNVLLRRGASVHARYGHMSLLHILATDRHSYSLRKCIHMFSLEDFGPGDYSATPLKLAQDTGHKEVARLLKNYIHEAQRTEGSRSGLWTMIERMAR